jgi:hypothetical protein
MAIKACTQEQGHLLRNREHMQVVKESLDEGYCDISGRVGDLDFVGVSLSPCPTWQALTHTLGDMGSVKIYVSRGRILTHIGTATLHLHTHFHLYRHTAASIYYNHETRCYRTIHPCYQASRRHLQVAIDKSTYFL